MIVLRIIAQIGLAIATYSLARKYGGKYLGYTFLCVVLAIVNMGRYLVYEVISLAPEAEFLWSKVFLVISVAMVVPFVIITIKMLRSRRAKQ